MREEYQYKQKKSQNPSGIILNQKQVKEGIGELHDIDPNNIYSAKTDHRALSLST